MSMEQRSRAPFGGRVLGSRFALGAFASSIVGGGLIAVFVESPWRAPALGAALGVYTLSAAALAVLARSVFWVLWAAYGALVGGATYLQWTGAEVVVGVLAAGSVLVALSTIAYAAREGRRSRELERFVFTEATSTAFFVTMLVALAYALLESWFEVPRLSMWVLFMVGMFTWGAASIVLRQKLT